MDNSASSLGEALAWLDRHVNLEAIERGAAGRASEPTLSRIQAFMDAMAEPQRAYPVIHVTGTNGKGSTTRLATNLLLARGLSVGTYISPDLEFLNERIMKDGAPIGDDELFAALSAIAALEGFVTVSDTARIAPTWFELVTATGLRYFADSAVDAAVIEVGLGGRYDATNVVDGAVAVVTNVELDHVEILGPTRAHIAAEKAGIIKAGSTVVIGEEDPDIATIFEAEAELVGAEATWRRGLEFDCTASRLAHGGRVIDLRTPGGRYDEIFLPLFGAHQGANAAVALSAAEAFFGSPLDEDVVAEAFAKTTVPGRLEIIGRHPLVVVDGAHNVAGAAALAAALDEDFAQVAHIVAIVGCLRGRDPEEMLRVLRSDRLTQIVACTPLSPRALPAEAVAEAATRLGMRVETHAEIDEALLVARRLAGADDLVLVCGSLKVVGPARRAANRLSSIDR